MSMMNYLFDSSWRQRAYIEELTRRQLISAKLSRMRRIRDQRKKDDREDDLGQLALYCRTAVTLMVEKGLVTQEEFTTRMNQIDASDGAADGKYTGKS